MKMNRVWIEIVLLGTAIACALALLIATVGAAAGAAAGEVGTPQERPATSEQAYVGMVTCSHCGAKHSAVLGHTATDCVRICVHGGASFALVDANTTYLLKGDLDSLKGLAGQRVRVMGALNGKTITISSVAAQS